MDPGALTRLAAHDPEHSLGEWLQQIRSEYRQVPGLKLTTAQAQRLWALDPLTCQALLGALVDVKFLRRTRQGTYIRGDQG